MRCAAGVRIAQRGGIYRRDSAMTMCMANVGSASADAVPPRFDVRRSVFDVQPSPLHVFQVFTFPALADPFRPGKDPERTRFGRGFLSPSCLDLSTTPAPPTPSEKPRPARNFFSAPTARNAPPHAVIGARSRHSAPTKRSHPCNAHPHTFQPPRPEITKRTHLPLLYSLVCHWTEQNTKRTQGTDFAAPNPRGLDTRSQS
jgi:hypothetical protein